MPMRLPHPKTIVVALLSAGLVVLAAYFILMDLVVIPRAEATIDRVGLRLEAPAALAAGERGTLVLRVDNRDNSEPVKFRDAMLTPELAGLVRFDHQALRALGAQAEGGRVVWDREIPAGGHAEFALPFHAAAAGRRAGTLRVLFEVPRVTKGRFLPLTIEVR